MIKENKLKKSVTAIHDLIIKVKLMAVQNSSHLEIYNLIDDLEFLPQLIVHKEDRTELFDNYLKGICEKFNFPDIINKYESE